MVRRLKMKSTKFLQGPCGHCGAMIKYQAEMIATMTRCPHCGEQTELTLAAPPQEPAVSRKAIVWTLTAILLLAVGLAGSLVALKLAQHRLQQQQQNAPAP